MQKNKLSRNRKKIKNKKLIWIIIILIIIAASVSIPLLIKHNNNSRNQAALTDKTYTVKAVSREEVVEISGNIEPVNSEDLFFIKSGLIKTIKISEGDFVKAGALTAELDDSNETYAVALIDYEIDQEKLSGSNRRLELLELERDIKISDLNDTKLYTSISGRVSSVDKNPGEYINGGNSRIARIIDISAMKATVEIDELDVPNIKAGQRVRFFFDALPELEVSGSVYSIPIEGRVTQQGIAVLDAEVIIDNPPEEILISYSFTGEIIVSDSETVLVLNKDGIIEKNGRTFVLLMPKNDDPPKPKPVKTAEYQGNEVRILSGLSEGEIVLSAGVLEQLSQNQQDKNPLQMLGLPGGGGRLMGGSPPGGKR